MRPSVRSSEARFRSQGILVNSWLRDWRARSAEPFCPGTREDGMRTRYRLLATAACVLAFGSGVVRAQTAPARPRCDLEHRRDLCRESQLRRSLRRVPRRERAAERDGGECPPARPRRHAAQGAAAGLGRAHRQGRDPARDPGADGEPGERAFRDRRPNRVQHAAERGHARSVAPLLPEPDADPRRQERHVRRLGR